MKQFILIITMLVTFPVFGQDSELFKQLTDQYSDNEGFSASLLSSDMFDLYLKKKNLDDSSPVYAALKSLKSIVVVSQSNVKTSMNSTGASAIVSSEGSQIHEKILDYYKKNNFTLFKTEKRMGEDIKVYVNKRDDKIASLALITNSSASTNLVELHGDIDLKNVSELSKAINLRGLENLYKLDNNSSYYGVYPSGAYSQAHIDEMIARQKEMYEKQHQLTEEQRRMIELKAQEMAEKQREMAEKYGREPIFLSHPGDTNTVFYIDGKKVKPAEMKSILPDDIESIEVNKPKKDNGKTTIKIKTK